MKMLQLLLKLFKAEYVVVFAASFHSTAYLIPPQILPSPVCLCVSGGVDTAAGGEEEDQEGL